MFFARGPRNKQPHSPVLIDRSNKFGKQAVIACYPIGNQMYDAVRRVAYNPTGGTGTWTAVHGPGGRYVGNAGSGTTDIRQEACPVSLLTSQPHTMLCIIWGLAVGWDAFPAMQLRDLSSGSAWNLRVTRSTATAVVFGMNAFGGSPTQLTCEVGDSLQPHVYLATQISSGNWRLFIDGVFVGTQAQTADANQSGTDTAVRIAGSTCTMSLAAWLAPLPTGGTTGVMSDADCVELSLNPWQMLQPDPRHVFLDAAAAGGGGTFTRITGPGYSLAGLGGLAG